MAPPLRRLLLAGCGLAVAAAAATAAPPPPLDTPALPPPTARIFGGTVTPAGEAPLFLAQFTTPGSNSTLLCAGVLITPRHVITVASCPIVPGTTVRVGTQALGVGGVAFVVASVAPPPYRNTAVAPMADNLAVVTFIAAAIWTADRLATFGAIPATLADGSRSDGPEQPVPGLNGRVWGWGTPSIRRSDPLRPPGGSPLRSAAAVVVEAEACGILFSNAGSSQPYDVYCAKSVGQGPCDGDVGAGLVSNLPANRGGGAYVHGMYSVSWSSTALRCVPSFPQGYTGIARHSEYIRTAVLPQTVRFVRP